tara:strand:- start:855 stop:2369 length:1515 start_codon:yes stop_codon:yes gene_type:complete
MGGGLMQLVAYGAQDVYLTGEPQITFFKVVYRRHTNFSVEPIVQTFSGSSDFGRTVTCNINRNGDLISKMYVVVDLDAHDTEVATNKWGYVSRLGHALIEHVKVEIGGSKIDEHYGDWLNIWHELSRNSNLDRGYDRMIGNTAEMKALTTAHGETRMYIPLQFWFNRNNGLALPLIALQYHDVRMTIKFRDASGCVNYSGAAPSPQMKDATLLIDYIYLDTEERKRFAQAQHEYLIEQLQFTGSESVPSTNNKYRLNFNHPSKFLTWAIQDSDFRNKEFLDWAHDGDWEAALNRAAKKIWVATHTIDDGSDDTLSLAEALGATYTGTGVGGTDAVQDNGVGAEIVAIPTTLAPAADGSDIQLVSHNLTIADLATVVAGVATVTVNDHFNYGSSVDSTSNPVKSSRLQLNGHERFTERDGNYFNYVQPYQHFSNTPADGVNVYSFALEPEKHQPSGTCNFSRIDNTTLNVNLKQASGANSVINIYTVNYNVLRVMSGMAGVAYSN